METETGFGRRVVGVIGGSGGVGASSFAAVLAAVAGASSAGGSVLVDLDVSGGGADVLLGVEAAAGARWSGLHVVGGRLAADVLVDGLPRWGPCAVLAADVPTIAADAVLQVIEVASSVASVVVDLPRSSCAERAAALVCCDLVVVLARGDVGGLVAAHAVVSGLPELPLGLVVRRGAVSGRQAADLVGVPLLGELPAAGSRFALDHRRLPRAAERIATGVLAGVDRRVVVESGAVVAA
jgi:hypothetical protein